MEIGDTIRTLAMIVMVAPMLAGHIPALRPYHRQIWIATAALYIFGGSGALLWRFVIRDWVTGG